MSALMLEAALKVPLILLPALAAAAALRRRSAALRHWVLTAAVIGAWTMPALTGMLPPWLDAPVWDGSAPVARGAPGEDVSARPVRAPEGAERQTIAAAAAARTRPAAAARASRVAWRLWLFGTLASALTLGAGLARLRWFASRARVIETGPWRERCDRMRRAAGQAAEIRLLQADRASLLVTWGWRRPTILLPAAAEEWDHERIDVVLAHELAHIARGDWAVQLAAESLRALYWFNPLTWTACRRLRSESERACDDAVLARGIDGPAYAAHLLELARSIGGRHPSVPAPAMARPSSLEGRFRAMLNTTIDRHPVSWRNRIATVTALLAVALPVAGIRAQPRFYSLAGTVFDPTDRVVPGAKLVLTNEASHARYEIQSDEAGRFEFVGLPPAAFALDAGKPGFAALTERIRITSDVRRNLRLRVAAVQESIRITDRPAPAAPDAAMLQKREEALRRFAAVQQREQERCSVQPAPDGGHIFPPAKLVDVKPIYPEHLKAAGVGGTVTMDAVIGRDGIVQDVRNVKGPDPALENAAAEAVRQWRFSAALLNCEPIDVEMKVTTEFSAQR